MSKNPRTELIPADYTERLGNIVDYWGYDIFDFEYNLWHPPDITEEEAKQHLQESFINYFYMREIAQETIELFKFYLRQQWLLFIDDYNLLFEARYNMTVDDIFKDNYNKQTHTMIQSDTPITPINPKEMKHVSLVMTNETENETRTGTKFNALQRYANNIYPVYLQFFSQFENLFIQIFKGV